MTPAERKSIERIERDLRTVANALPINHPDRERLRDLADDLDEVLRDDAKARFAAVKEPIRG